MTAREFRSDRRDEGWRLGSIPIVTTPRIGRALATCALLAIAAAARAATHHPSTALTVRLYDLAGLAHGELRTAQTTAAAVLRHASIGVAWRPCHIRLDCHDVVGPAELIVRIVPLSPSDTPDSLGYSLVDRRVAAGTMATVFARRIGALAESAGSDPGELLGRTIAHEIGHLLLGTSRHADRGLMRGHWATADLRRRDPSLWLFTAREAAELRRALDDRRDRGLITLAARLDVFGGTYIP